MITRRSFSFASLLLAASAVARAEGPIAEAEPVAPEPETPPGPFEASFVVVTKPGRLSVTMNVTNKSADVIDFAIKRGSSPGAGLQAWLVPGEGQEDIALAQVMDNKQRREMMSRMGPTPVYQPIKPAEVVLAGVYEFDLPKGAEGEALKFTGYLDFMTGYQEIVYSYTPSPAGV